MNDRKQIPLLGILAGVVAAAAIAVGAVAFLRIDPSGDRGSGLPEAFDYDLQQYQKIDPALIGYKQTAEIACGLDEVRAVAVGADDRTYIAGDRSIRIFSTDGMVRQDIALEDEPRCLAVGSAGHGVPGTVYVGFRDHVEVLRATGKREALWERPGPRSVLTSIALADEHVFVADAGTPMVWHYDLGGKLLGSIGKRDEARGVPQLVVPSPYFDVAVAPDGLLRVVNPGMHRIQAFTFAGDLEDSWGKQGMGVEAFCGCCNPSNIAIFPDGRVVTAEKGIPRVKVYSESGKFECVVVGPDVLAPNSSATTETRDDLRLHPADLAIDSRGRILVLDPASRCVRVFEKKQ